MRLTIPLILARALSRRVQSIVTLFFTWVINSAAMSLSLSSPIAHQRLQRGPLCLELLLLRQILAFRDLFKLRIDLRQLGGVQAELGTEGAEWGD